MSFLKTSLAKFCVCANIGVRGGQGETLNSVKFRHIYARSRKFFLNTNSDWPFIAYWTVLEFNTLQFYHFHFWQPLISEFMHRAILYISILHYTCCLSIFLACKNCLPIWKAKLSNNGANLTLQTYSLFREYIYFFFGLNPLKKNTLLSGWNWLSQLFELQSRPQPSD